MVLVTARNSPNNSPSTALAYGVLIYSALTAIYECWGNYLSVIGFGMYLGNGLLGLIAYGSDTTKFITYCNSHLSFSLSFSLPLFISQLYLNAGFDVRIALLHFIPPVFNQFLLPHFQTSNASLNMTPKSDPWLVVQLASLVYVSILNQSYFGLSTVVSYLIAFYAIGPSGTVYSAPSRVLFNYTMSFSIYFLAHTLKEQ